MSQRSLAQWLAFAESTHPQSIDMTLERVRGVARRMGLLDPTATRFIIVAGTNGKGSTTIGIEALLLAQGFSVGATLSPHLHRFNERVRLNAVEAGDLELCEAFAAVDLVRGDTTLTYFEFATLVALEVFRRHRVDFAVLEIGLGGRLDAFNIIDAQIAVVTSIGLDHQAYLGSDLEQIGREKAGVFREGQTVVLGAVTESVYQEAEKLHCQIFQAGKDFSVAESATYWTYRGPGGEQEGLPQGSLAPINWALALTVVNTIQRVSTAQLTQALATAELPGRMEIWNLEDRRLVLDIAHNPAAAKFLSQRLSRLSGGLCAIGILGMLSDKDPQGVVEELEDTVEQWILVPTTGGRGMDVEQLQQRLTLPRTPLIAPSVAAALSTALSLTRQGDAILALGSFAVVEQSRNCLQQSRDFTATRQELF